MTPDEFISAIAPAAKASAARTGIPASFTVAEAAVESGWGAHAPGLNLFGIKADPAWHGPVTTQQTRECIAGKWIMVQAKFRAYTSWLGSITDHAEFLQTNPRYKPAFSCKSGPAFCSAVAAAGYATDPHYAVTINSIIASHHLEKLDAA